MSYEKKSSIKANRAALTEADAIVLHPDLDKIGYLCRRVSITHLQRLQASIPDLEVTAGQLGTLILIGSNPGITPTKICRAQGHEKATVTTALDYLERKKLISRQVSASDRRSFAITLTKSGLRLYKHILPRVASADQDLTRCLNARERSILRELLLRIYEHEC
jgi:DNA-binding MarR family transcriptional regulator